MALTMMKMELHFDINLTKKQKEMLQQFESSLESKNYAKRDTFFKKLKDLIGKDK